MRLQPIGSWDVRGPADERGWWYRLDEYGPHSNSTDVVSGMSVIHCRYAVDSARPWYGLAPLQWARATGTLAANLETRLGEEAGGPVGHLLRSRPMAATAATAIRSPCSRPTWRRAGAEPCSPRRQVPDGVRAGKRRPPKTGSHAASGRARRTRLPTLRTDAALAVLSACQVPAALFTDADGTSQRESWRRWAMGPLAGLAATVEAEAGREAGSTRAPRLLRTVAHDLAGRASSFKAMVTAGMDVAKAAGLAGLMAED